MIFKWLTFEKDNDGKNYHDVWHFVDNVKEVSVFWNEDTKCTCASVWFGDGREMVTYAVHNAGYLLSDSGKTIERVKVPEWVKQPEDKPDGEWPEPIKNNK